MAWTKRKKEVLKKNYWYVKYEMGVELKNDHLALVQIGHEKTQQIIIKFAR